MLASYFNKKAGSRITYSLSWLLLIILAVGGIAVSAFAFSSYKVDTRDFEAKILAKHLLQCITENGAFKEEIFTEHFNLEISCGLNLKVDGFYEYHISLILYNFNSCNNGICTTINEENGKQLTVKIGDQSLPTYCSTNEVKGNAPKCYEENFYILYNNQPSFLGIKIAVNKQQQNVK